MVLRWKRSSLATAQELAANNPSASFGNSVSTTTTSDNRSITSSREARDAVFAVRPPQRVVLAGYQEPSGAGQFQIPSTPSSPIQDSQSSLQFPRTGDEPPTLTPPTRTPQQDLQQPAEDLPSERLPTDPQPSNPTQDDEAAPAPPTFGEEQIESPFPQRQEDDENASDANRRSDDADSDSADREDTFEDCDRVRSRALADDIANVRLDTAPEFPLMADKQATSKSKQDAFVQKAPNRAWYDNQGRFVVDAKLIDLVNEYVVLKSESGATQRIHLYELSDADLVYVSEVWGLPVSCTLGSQLPPDRNFVPATMNWRASGLCHKPLYFEDVQLERYGHEVGPVMQPILSTARFFGDVVTMPYKMGIHPMNECQYSLGYYRPGSCAPWTLGPVPISLRGGLFQAAAVTGVVGAIP